MTVNFNLTEADGRLAKRHSIVLENVDDVGQADGTKIEFQFPPIIKSDKKDGKWEILMNVPGYEPTYKYQGANPRSLTLESTYVVGGPPVGGGSSITHIQNQLRVWKKYFYIKGLKLGENLPIWRIQYMGGPTGYIPSAGMGSAWRCMNYNVKHSDEWIEQARVASHPLVTTITVELQLSTQVDVTATGDPKQPHGNIQPIALRQWY
jgi:hypothetical protein